MSQRRMFSPDIVDSDAFLDMPSGSQLLYFHLCMKADDDGFVSPKKVMRTIGSTDDELKVLIAKRFVLVFESGVVVVKHWLIHNMIRKDRYKETRYLEEKKSLEIKENKSYTESSATNRQPNGNQPATQVRLGKVRLGTNNNTEDSIIVSKDTIKKKTESFILKLKEHFKGQTLTHAQADEVKSFASYWTEPNKSETKLRWELEKTWDLGRRLKRWMDNKTVNKTRPGKFANMKSI